MKKLLLLILIAFSFSLNAQKVGTFKTGNVGDTYFENYSNYLVRVSLDSSLIESKPNTFKILKGLKAIGILDSVKFLWTGEMGYKERVSGIYHYATKLFSNDSLSNNATQVTEVNQPYLSGNIAPNEKLCLNNPNGGAGFISHDDIGFGSGEGWCLTFVMNWNCINAIYESILKSSSDLTNIIIRNGSNNNLFLVNSTGGYTVWDAINNIIGKISIIQLVSTGTTVELIINNISFGVHTLSGLFTFDKFLIGDSGSNLGFAGKYYSHLIHAKALTSTQVTAEYNLLRSIYPEMESVVIGTQEWTTSNLDIVTTCMGNVIPNVIANSKVEKVSDWDFTVMASINVTIIDNNSFQTVVGAGGGILFTNTLTIGKWYKIEIAGTSGSVNIINNNSPYNMYKTNAYGINYLKAQNTGFILASNGDNQVDITTISVQELGWANSTELYDGLIAQGYTVADATKETTMWCYYNNDPVLGSIYGKLYNWYAVKLIQDDIDAYNIANPLAHWGWHCGIPNEYETLSTYLGGDAISSGKMKMIGLNYWDTPNEGATNESGFTSLGGGIRNESGVCEFLNDNGRFWTPVAQSVDNAFYVITHRVVTELYRLSGSKNSGYFVRMVKD